MQDELRRLSLEEVSGMIEPGDDLVYPPAWKDVAAKLARSVLCWHTCTDFALPGIEVRRRGKHVGRIIVAAPQQLARELLAAACADSRPGVPLAQRLEEAAPEVLGPHLR